MKKLFLYLVIFFPVILSSCKDNDPKPSDLNIQGKWELEYFQGAWTGGRYAPGTGPVLIFQKKTYQEFKGDKLIRSGSYKIVRAQRSLVNREGDRLDFEGKDEFPGQFVSVDKDKLIISIDAYHAPSYSYRRIE